MPSHVPKICCVIKTNYYSINNLTKSLLYVVVSSCERLCSNFERKSASYSVCARVALWCRQTQSSRAAKFDRLRLPARVVCSWASLSVGREFGREFGLEFAVLGSWVTASRCPLVGCLVTTTADATLKFHQSARMTWASNSNPEITVRRPRHRKDSSDRPWPRMSCKRRQHSVSTPNQHSFSDWPSYWEILFRFAPSGSCLSCEGCCWWLLALTRFCISPATAKAVKLMPS